MLIKFMKFITRFEYFPHQGLGNIKSGNSFHKFHMPHTLVQDPPLDMKCLFKMSANKGFLNLLLWGYDLQHL
jgi:hypothetical protein